MCFNNISVISLVWDVVVDSFYILGVEKVGDDVGGIFYMLLCGFCIVFLIQEMYRDEGVYGCNLEEFDFFWFY